MAARGNQLKSGLETRPDLH